MALQFAIKRHMYPSSTTIRLIIHAVAEGKIQNLEETIKEKEEMKQQIQELISERLDLEEYFKMIESQT